MKFTIISLSFFAALSAAFPADKAAFAVLVNRQENPVSPKFTGVEFAAVPEDKAAFAGELLPKHTGTDNGGKTGELHQAKNTK